MQETNVINYFIGDDKICTSFIRGHLYIEKIMSEILIRAYKNPKALKEVSNTFFKKVKLLRAIDCIDEGMEKLLLEINSVRNKIAHNFEYDLKYEEIFELIKLAGNNLLNFSDDDIFKNFEYSKQNYEPEDLGVRELMANTFSKLLYDNERLFKDLEYGIDTFLT